jgi:hypothetical protein
MEDLVLSCVGRETSSWHLLVFSRCRIASAHDEWTKPSADTADTIQYAGMVPGHCRLSAAAKHDTPPETAMHDCHTQLLPSLARLGCPEREAHVHPFQKALRRRS